MALKRRPADAQCEPQDVAVKALFLGTQAENGPWLEDSWQSILARWLRWRSELFPRDGYAISKRDFRNTAFVGRRMKLSSSLEDLLSMLENECPKFTPRYLGHMVSETSMPALLGHVAALLHNPNNSSREVSKVGTTIEREAIQGLLRMVGFSSRNGTGHFTSGGTIANLEGMWRALYRFDRLKALNLFVREKKLAKKNDFSMAGWGEFDFLVKKLGIEPRDLAPYSLLNSGPWQIQKACRRILKKDFRPPVLLVPASCHYSWSKIVTLLGLGSCSLREISLDRFGRMDLTSLKRNVDRELADKNEILALVSVLGSTELGAVDPLAEIQEFLSELSANHGIKIWHHVDAAYGGYFSSLVSGRKRASSLSSDVASSLQALPGAHSITLDPHKLGYVPYSCGAVLCRDEASYRVRTFSAHYLLNSNDSRWVHTIEGSRAATGAAATWMTNRTLGLGANGYGRVLKRGINARNKLLDHLARLKESIYVVPSSDLNIVCLALAKTGESMALANARTRFVFEEFVKSPYFSVSKTTFDREKYAALVRAAELERDLVVDDSSLVCLRLVLMNPFTCSKETRVDYLASFVEELQRLDLLSLKKVRNAR